jgi:hypothetical protein
MSIKACKLKDLTLDLILLYTDYILSLFKKLKDEYKEDPTFSVMFNSRWKKMDKYYRASNKTPAYVTAVVLHPS